MAVRCGVRVDKVHNVIIWGNHSSTQYPDVSHGQLEGGQKISDAVKDDAWLHGEFITVEWREREKKNSNQEQLY